MISRTLIHVASAALLVLPASSYAMKPGLWEITTEMSGDSVPKMPPMSDAQRKQMAAMGIQMPASSGAGMVMTIKHCVTKADAERRAPPVTDEDRRNRCEQKDVRTTGNTTSWVVECSGEHKMRGTGSVTHLTDTAYNGETVFTTQDAKRGPTTMKQKFSGKLLSAQCK